MPSSWVDLRHCDPAGLNSQGWRDVAVALKPAIDRSCEMDLVKTLRSVKEHDSALWLLHTQRDELVGAIVCNVLEFQSGYKVLLVQSCATAGANITWDNGREIIRHFEDVAVFSECDAVRIVGRKGWGRLLPDYTEVSRTFDKVVRKGH